MELNNDLKIQLCNAFRQHMLDMIIKNLMEWSKNSCMDPNFVSHVLISATQIEYEAFNFATTKDDYLAKIQERMRLVQYALLADTGAANTSASFPDANTWYTSERKLLMDLYNAMRVHLPELMRLHNCAEEYSIKSQSVVEREKHHELKFKFGQMINFLNCDGSFLKHVSNETLSESLKDITLALNERYYKHEMTSQNYAPQFLNEQVSENYPQNISSAELRHTIHSSTPLMSSPVMGKVQLNAPILQSTASSTPSNAPNPQLNAPYSPLYGSRSALKRVDMPTVLDNAPHIITEQSARLGLKQNSELMKSSCMDQPTNLPLKKKPRKVLEKKECMDSMFLPRTKINSGNVQRQPSKRRSSSSKRSAVHKRNASCNSEPRSISQQKPSIEVETLSSPRTLPKGNGKNPIVGVAAIKCETEVQDKCISLEIPGTSVSSVSSDKSDQKNQPPKSELLPVERLIQEVQSKSPEILEIAIEEISSAMVEMDKLPMYAFHDESKSPKMNSGSTDCKELEHEYDSKSKEAPATKKPRKTAKSDLISAELTEIKSKLIETSVEVVFDSEKGTIVRCTYMPVAFSDDLKRHFAFMCSTLSVEFLVPPLYPKISPIILNGSTLHSDGCGPEGKDIEGTARAMFDHSIRGLISISEMAKAWDDCGRKIFTDLAIHIGGGKTFDDRYGAWRNTGLS